MAPGGRHFRRRLLRQIPSGRLEQDADNGARLETVEKRKASRRRWKNAQLDSSAELPGLQPRSEPSGLGHRVTRIADAQRFGERTCHCAECERAGLWAVDVKEFRRV